MLRSCRGQNSAIHNKLPTRFNGYSIREAVGPGLIPQMAIFVGKSRRISFWGASENERPVRCLGISNFFVFVGPCYAKTAQLMRSPVRSFGISSIARFSHAAQKEGSFAEFCRLMHS